MDELFEAKINNIINEMTNVISKQEIDSLTSRTLMAVAINRLSMLMTHIGYLEAKLESISAENQRLNQIARY